MLNKLNKDSGYLLFIGISLAIGLPLMILMIASSIGGLMLKPWARIGMLIYAVGSIVNGIGGAIFNILYVTPLMLSALAPNDPARAGAMGGAIGGSCGGLIGLIFPICILIFYTRPNVINAFKGISPRSRDEDENDYDDRRDRRDRRDRNREDRDPEDDDRITDRRG